MDEDDPANLLYISPEAKANGGENKPGGDSMVSSMTKISKAQS